MVSHKYLFYRQDRIRERLMENSEGTLNRKEKKNLRLCPFMDLVQTICPEDYEQLTEAFI